MTAPARAAFQQSFVDEAWAGIGPFQEALVNAHPEVAEEALFPLVEAEVQRRAVALRKLFYTRLGAASAKARQRKGRAADRPAPTPHARSNDTAAEDAS